MTNNQPVSREAFDEMHRLVAASLCGDISSEEERRLAELVHRDAETFDLYLNLVHESSILLTWAGHGAPKTIGSTGQPDETSGRTELNPTASAPLAAADGYGSGRPTGIVFPTSLSTTFHGTVGDLSSGWPVAYLIATVVLGIGLVIGAVTHVSQPEQVVQHTPVLHSPPSALHSVVGRITGMVDCQFAEGSGFRTQDSPLPQTGQRQGVRAARVPSPLSLVSLGDKFVLTSGLLEVTYDTGARVILQGPVTYEVESPAGGYLSLGRLTARVEASTKYGVRSTERVASGQWAVDSGTPSPEYRVPSPEISNPLSPIPNPLFAVRTPTATVTDLGTEFGVEVARSGETTSHVFRGSIRVQRIGAHGTVAADDQIVRENQTVRVEGASENCRIVTLQTFTPSHFIRSIPKQVTKTLDLVDVVAGGDGFSGKRNRGINPLTGRPADVSQLEAEYSRGDRRYHRVEGLPYVDGVFVPDGGPGPVQIASTGLSFDGFAGTSNDTAHAIWAGGAVPAGGPQYPTPRTKLDGVDYSSAGHGLLFLHANKGITFDLGAIRQANPGCKLLRFRAMAGNTEFGSEQGFSVFADVWVLVDGQTRFRRREINGLNGGFSVALPIGEQDRFLTLAATDAGNEISWDWIIFGDPRLEMLSTDAGAADDRPQKPSARSRER